MDVVVHGIPSTCRHVDPAPQPDVPGDLLAAPDRQLLLVGQVLVPLGNGEQVVTRRNVDLETAIRVEGTIRLLPVATSHVPLPVHDGYRLFRRHDGYPRRACQAGSEGCRLVRVIVGDRHREAGGHLG